MEKKLNFNDNELQEIVRLVSNVVNPEKVILFGSFARNQANKESDLDLLIVCNGKDGKIENRGRKLGNIYRELAHVNIEKDIVLFSIEEFEHWKHSNNHIIANACRDGKVLYER